jgi:hypothetical protein
MFHFLLDEKFSEQPDKGIIPKLNKNIILIRIKKQY